MGSIDPDIPAYGVNGENGLDPTSTISGSPRLIDSLPELYSENITAKVLRVASEHLSRNVSRVAWLVTQSFAYPI